jgi:hypothetical protein
MFGLIFICLGFFFLLITSRAIRVAEDGYKAIGWKVNIRIFKYFWMFVSIAIIVFGTLRVVGLIRMK